MADLLADATGGRVSAAEDASGEVDNAAEPAAAESAQAEPPGEPAPGTNLAARLAAAAAADAAAAAELAASDPDDLHGGRMRRATKWLFAPKRDDGGPVTDEVGTDVVADVAATATDEDLQDDLEIREALADSEDAPVRPWLRPRVAATPPPDEARSSSEADEPEPADEPAPADEPEPADSDEEIRPGADLVRRLADANATALSNTRMGTPPAMPEAAPPPTRFARLRRTPTVVDEPVPLSEPVESEPARGGATAAAKKATAPPANDDGKPRPHPWRRLIVVIVIAAATAISLRAYVLAPYYIPSASMEHTLHGCTGCNNDHVLVDKLSYKLHDPHRGDVVVFHRPSTWTVSEKLLIKRVIGLPGDVLSSKDGVVYVNGLEVQEPYVDPDCTGGTTNLSTVTVPDGEVFMMGDNRCNSEDSRVFGAVDTSEIVGRAFVIVWPLGRIHWL